MAISDPDIDLCLADAGRLETALDVYCDALPALHRTCSGDAEVRQLVAFGASEAGDGGIVLAPGAWLCIETARGRLHAFRSEGARTKLPESAFGSLAAIADATFAAHAPGSASLEVEWHPRGWRALEAAESMEELFASAPPVPEAAGVRLSALDARVLCEDPEEPADALWSAFASCFPELDGPEARTAAWGRLSALAAPLLAQFVSRLQAQAVAACNSLGRCGLGAYNALAHACPRRALYRAQAACAIPALGLLLVEKSENWLLPVRIAIDARARLVDAAANALRVPREAVRFLADKALAAIGLDDAEAGELWLAMPHYVMACIAAVAPEHRPRSEAEWAAFHALIRPLRQWQEHLPGLIAPFLRRAGSRGYAATLEAVEAKLGHPGRLSEFGGFLDCLWRAARRRQANAMPDEEARFRLAHAARRGLLRLALDAQRWRKAVVRETTRILAKAEKEAGAGPLDLPFAPPRSIDGYRIAFLASASDMVAEGVRMSHCIETLYPSAVRGERLAFSIRDAKDQPIATFDISLRRSKDGCKAKLNEVNGPQNEPAGPAACAVVARFVPAVTEALEGREAAVDAWLQSRRGRPARNFERERQRVVRRAELAAIRPFLVAAGLNAR